MRAKMADRISTLDKRNLPHPQFNPTYRLHFLVSIRPRLASFFPTKQIKKLIHFLIYNIDYYQHIQSSPLFLF
jgi:hypothetical protein